MKIVVDAFGGDNSPIEVIKGAILASKEYKANIILSGDKKKISSAADKNNLSLEGIIVEDAEGYISMEDDADVVMKDKKNSSMARGLSLLAEGKADAFISAGNSGALVFGSTMIVKRMNGIKRCAFAPIIPSLSGPFMVIDAGANVVCRAEMLRQFAIMGSIYMEKVMGVKNPTVGLANNGTEAHKGTPLQTETFELLKSSDLNFLGNIEAREIPEKVVDVVVTDGFTGNIIIKLYEGVAISLMKRFKNIIYKNAKTKFAGALISSELKELKKDFDYNEKGGAIILGLKKPVFKVHGSAKAKAFKNAIGLAACYISKNVSKKIAEALSEMEIKGEKQ